MERKEVMNVVYSSDDNYVQHAVTSIVSLAQNNKNFKKINIYLIENNISIEKRNQVENLIEKYEQLSLEWINFSKWLKRLKLNMQWDISISAYARLFISEMLDKNIDKILYLDCDIIVNQSIYDLWNMDIKEYYIGAVQDAVNDNTKNSVGIESGQPYYNSGVLLINLKKWREDNISEKFLQFIEKHHGKVVHHDQGVINGVLKSKIYKLPLKYNVMTIHYIFNRNQIMRYYKESTSFYNEKEIENAKEVPSILHYTPSFTVRPWIKGCKHPKKGLYWKYLNMTPWKDLKNQKNQEKWYIRIINWLYRNFYR